VLGASEEGSGGQTVGDIKEAEGGWLKSVETPTPCDHIEEIHHSLFPPHQ
jgi:hypothetical protein